jgi:hypothetical protein
MDPQAAWDELVQAYDAGDWCSVLDLAEGLEHWLSHGGFPPKTQPGLNMDERWNREVALAACRLAAERAREEDVS